MRFLPVILALALTAAFAHADSGTLNPGDDVVIGNIHIANLEGAGGSVNYASTEFAISLVVHDDAVCAVLKRGPEPQSHRVGSLVLGGGFYAQANVNGAYIAVLGDNAAALALALRPRHTNNGNTIDLLGNGNIAAAVRWCYGEGQALMNKIRFGLNSLFSASFNDAYISGDTKGTSDLLWANRTVDVAGEGNETIAWDGFACRDDRNDDLAPRDVAVDPADIRKDRSDAAKTDAVALDRG